MNKKTVTDELYDLIDGCDNRYYAKQGKLAIAKAIALLALVITDNKKEEHIPPADL